LYRM